ncbi:MAG: hypothetical protein VW835_02015 [Rickettsiales bacterium]|jgi:hypothetical protein
MVPELEYRKATDEHLRTWERVVKLFTVSVIGIAILLGLMAATLL